MSISAAVRFTSSKRDCAISADQALDALDDYADGLRTELAGIKKRLEKLEDKIEANEMILVLLDDPSFDPTDPKHAKLFDRAGINPNQSKDDIRDDVDDTLDATQSEHEELSARAVEIERQLPLIEEARRRIEAGEDPSKVLDGLKENGIEVQVDHNGGEPSLTQLTDIGKNLDIEKQAIETQLKPDEPQIDPDAEVEGFMQSFAFLQMANEGDALKDALSSEIDALSDEAKEVLSSMGETRFLFEDSAETGSDRIQSADIENHQPDGPISSGLQP